MLLVSVLGTARPRLAATNAKVITSGVALTVDPAQERCQSGEFVPHDVATLRLYTGTLGRPGGEPLVVSLARGDGELVSRSLVPGGYRPGVLDVRIPAPRRDLVQARFCVRNAGPGPMAFAGNLTPAGYQPQHGLNGPGARPTDEIRVDYFRPGRESWWKLAPEVARRFELFKPGFFGAWALWATLALVLLLWAGAVALLLGRRRSPSRAPPVGAAPAPGRPRAGRLPPAALACAAIAVVNAAVWAVICPPFQVIDEPVHAEYAEYLAATGRVPRVGGEIPRGSIAHFSRESRALLAGMPFSVEGRPSWSAQQDRQLRHQLARIPTAARESGAGGAARYSPLYYGFEALAAKAGGGMSAIDRLYAMRVLSATLAGATVAFVFLFLRELLPGTPWAWVVGALAVAFQPVFGFIGGGVNNDNLLFTASAALLFLVARSFRQGLTVRRGVAIGAVAMAGFLAKPTMLGLLPGAALGVALIVWRTPPGRRRAAVTAALAGLAVFAGAAAAWLAIDAAVFHRPLSETTGVLATSKVNGVTSLQGQLSYLWQFFLPKLPFMHEAFPTYPHYPVWDIYIQGFIGRFGWFQYGFPMSVNRAGFAVLLLVVALAGVALVRARDRVRRRWPELACYATMLVGVVLLVGGAGYRFQASVGMGFEQPRYLFPCLALYGAVLALAARAAGRRWGPALGAFLVVVAMAHSLFAMLLTVGRYYA